MHAPFAAECGHVRPPGPALGRPLQATLLLLEMLDLDKALAALAAGQPLDESSYVFAGAEVKQRVNAELASWWPAAAAAHSPVLLAWAAVLCLTSKSAGGCPRRRGAARPGRRSAGAAPPRQLLLCECASRCLAPFGRA